MGETSRRKNSLLEIDALLRENQDLLPHKVQFKFGGFLNLNAFNPGGAQSPRSPSTHPATPPLLHSQLGSNGLGTNQKTSKVIQLFPLEKAIALSNPDNLSSKSLRISVGLNNLGNTCFLNSAMQCLVHTVPLAQFSLKQQHSSICHINNIKKGKNKEKYKNREGLCWFCLFEIHTRQAFAGGTKSLSPKDLAVNIKKLNKRFKLGKQCDCHEFVICLRDQFQLAILGPNQQELREEEKETSFLYQIFGGKLRSQVKCLSCKYESNMFESFLDLSLDIQGSNTLEQCLKNFCVSERLEGQNKYFCEECNKKVVANKTFSIHRPPLVLVCHLKRFTNQLFKVKKRIQYPEVLDLSAYITDENFFSSDNKKKKMKCTYILYGIIVHLGGSSYSGHYYAFVKGFDNEWYLCDDSSVRPTNLPRVLGQSAYMLFYRRAYTELQNLKLFTPKAPVVCKLPKPLVKVKSKDLELESVGLPLLLERKLSIQPNLQPKERQQKSIREIVEEMFSQTIKKEKLGRGQGVRECKKEVGGAELGRRAPVSSDPQLVVHKIEQVNLRDSNIYKTAPKGNNIDTDDIVKGKRRLITPRPGVDNRETNINPKPEFKVPATKEIPSTSKADPMESLPELSSLGLSRSASLPVLTQGKMPLAHSFHPSTLSYHPTNLVGSRIQKFKLLMGRFRTTHISKSHSISSGAPILKKPIRKLKILETSKVFPILPRLKTIPESKSKAKFYLDPKDLSPRNINSAEGEYKPKFSLSPSDLSPSEGKEREKSTKSTKSTKSMKSTLKATISPFDDFHSANTNTNISHGNLSPINKEIPVLSRTVSEMKGISNIIGNKLYHKSVGIWGDSDSDSELHPTIQLTKRKLQETARIALLQDSNLFNQPQKRARDQYDLEYDRGKLKRVKNLKDRVKLPKGNMFQKWYQTKIIKPTI